jgi:hypothetical protein
MCSRILISLEGRLKSHPSFTSLLQNNLFRETVFSLLQLVRKTENRDYRMESPFQHPNTKIRYHASNMILNIHSDAGYLNESEARSRAGGHLFMSSTPKNGVQQHNGSILTFSKILRMVVASAAEAEIGALFLNAKEGVNIRNILKEMGHPQPATPMQTDNTTDHVILRGTCKQQRSKSIDMRFYWVRDRAQQG